MLDLKPILRERGLRQKQAAQSMGVSEATFSVWMSALRMGAHQRIPAEKAKRLAEVLEIAPGKLRPDLWPAEAA